jgi:hypothetical protein
MLLENIQNNIFEYLEDFEPEQIDKRKIKIVFCDKEMVIDVYDYYAIYALNLFFNFFNCIEDGDLINNFIKTVKEDIKQGHYILNKIDELDLPDDEKKEWVKEYIDTIINKKDVLSFLIEIGLF